MAELVKIDGPAGSLSGELVDVRDARSIVVIIPGSGPIDRDGNSDQLGLKSETYKLLATGLEKEGISSLRIDKRGFYGSSAAVSDLNDVTIKAYAEDANKWVERSAQIAPCVWIAGHSEGGLVALVAAQAPPKNLCGLILLATSGRPTGQLLIEQFRSNPANVNLIAEIEGIVEDLEAAHPRDPAEISPTLRPYFSDGLQRYMIDLFSYNPVIIAQSWRGRVLIVQGDADLQVKHHDADLLMRAMPQAERLDLSDATHMLKKNIAGNPFATYTDPTLPLHPNLIDSISQFINKAPLHVK